MAELVASGYAETSVEAIALRAGVHKTTIYRRWGTKDQLIANALAPPPRAAPTWSTPGTSTSTCARSPVPS
jgi:hypothetical protein